MLTTSHVEDYVLNQESGSDLVVIGGSHGQRILKERLLAQNIVDFDLNKGYYEGWTSTKNENTTKPLNVFLEWIIQKSPEGDLDKALNGAKFVCRRGILSRMAAGETLREKGDWQVVCERRKGVIFMQEEISPSVLDRRANMSDFEKKATYWGMRFEEYMIEDPPSLAFDSADELTNMLNNLSIKNTSNDIRMVMSAKLKNYDGDCFKLLYSGEVDAVDSEGRHVEMRTLKDRPTGFGFWFYKEKSLKWWLQSRFVGVDYLVVGLRDDDGRVQKLKKMTLSDLENRKWSGFRCLQFLMTVLKTIDEALTEGKACRVACVSGSLEITDITLEEAGILSKKFKDHFGM